MYVLHCVGNERIARIAVEKGLDDGITSVIGPFDTIKEAREYEKTHLHDAGVCKGMHLVFNVTRGSDGSYFS